MSDSIRARRGTSNKNVSGSAKDRRARRAWLVETYRADVVVFLWSDGVVAAVRAYTNADVVEEVPVCRCYRCGRLLTIETLTVDRIIPGCHGGTYRRNNIRPACGGCNSKTGGAVRSK